MATTNSKQIQKIIVILIIFAIVSQIYKSLSKTKDVFHDTKFADVPYEVKCFFEEPGCEDGNLDGWSLVYALLYFIIGLTIPNQYIAIILISIVYEIIQSFIGNQPRYILNPLISITAYSIGSLLSPYKKEHFTTKYPTLTN